MAILTLISDIGYNNHDLSRFRLRLKQEIPGLELEIVNASVARHDIAEAAYILNCILMDFPENTIHLLDVLPDLKAFGPALCAKIKDQWVISANNGLLSLLPFKAEKTGTMESGLKNKGGTFTLLNTFLPMARELFESKWNPGLVPVEELVEKATLLPVSTEKSMRGTVIFVDPFGNAVTNITRDLLEKNREGRKMLVRLNRHDWIDTISEFYSEAGDKGNVVCVWTSSGNLEVGVYDGDASRLLGLTKGKMITIDFE